MHIPNSQYRQKEGKSLFVACYVFTDNTLSKHLSFKKEALAILWLKLWNLWPSKWTNNPQGLIWSITGACSGIGSTKSDRIVPVVHVLNERISRKVT